MTRLEKMSEYGDRDRQCRGKRAFFDRAEAKRAARYTQRQPGQPYARMKVYACPFCGRWHVAHREPGRTP